MIVSSISSPTGTSRKTQPGAETAPQVEALPPSRALVSPESPSRTADRYMARPSAIFVAHLIAMAEQVPQTRVLRRETPPVAHGVYGRATAKSPPSFGRVVSQTV